MSESEDGEERMFVVGRRIDIPQQAPTTFAANSMESSGIVTLESPTIGTLVATRKN